MIDAILFDLDGILTDPGTGITKSVQYSLKKYQIDIKDLSKLYKFVGPPLKDSYMKYFSFSDEKAAEAVEYYREYYSEKGIYENSVYDGVPELLEWLKKRGLKIALATSKPTRFAKTIIRHFKMDRFFDQIIGSNLDNSRTDKKEIIEEALGRLKKKNSEVLMIGDRKFDIVGAKANGVKSVGVLYGYGSKEEIENEGPNFIAKNAADLGRIIGRITLPFRNLA